MLIFSHRGNQFGKNPKFENNVPYLLNAIKNNYNLEFDINFNLNKSDLVLSHDMELQNKLNNVDKFLAKVERPQFHALNIKNIYTIVGILNKLKEKNIKENFFLFDFELLIKDIQMARYLMQSICNDGFNIAYRLSEKENYFEEYLNNNDVKIIWLDEFEIQWVKKHHIRRLAEKNKQSIYVSPDLHGKLNINKIKKRWEQVVNYGITGICTDYPNELKKYFGE